MASTASSSSLDVPAIPSIISHPVQRSLTAPFIVGPDPAPDEISNSDDYVNPLDTKSRWNLSARAFALRQGAQLGFGIENRFSTPPYPTKTLYLDSTLSAYKGKGVIKVDVWVPPCCAIEKKRKHKRHDRPLRPAIINFHGGGFVLGQGTDDARWAATAMAELDAVVFAVNYRLAPSYPFPTPTEDCVDAICQISRLLAAAPADYSVDPDRVFLSGFSAGGNLALSSWLVLTDPQRWDYHLPQPVPKIAAIALFYPLLDWTTSRPRKRAACVRPDLTLPSSMTDLFDASYIYPPLPVYRRTDWRLSPGLMADAMLDRMPPLHLCLCEYDMLLTEGLTFAERLRLRGRPVEVRVVLGAKHAWDKPPPFVPRQSAGTEYAAALRSFRRWTDGGSDYSDEGSGSETRSLAAGAGDSVLSLAETSTGGSKAASRAASRGPGRRTIGRVGSAMDLRPPPSVRSAGSRSVGRVSSALDLRAPPSIRSVSRVGSAADLRAPTIRIDKAPVEHTITLVEQQHKGLPQDYLHRSVSFI